MRIYVSWIDKRHVTLRSTGLKHGASCHHFHDEKETEGVINGYLNRALADGFIIEQIAYREWMLSK